MEELVDDLLLQGVEFERTQKAHTIEKDSEPINPTWNVSHIARHNRKDLLQIVQIVLHSKSKKKKRKIGIKK